MSDQDIVRWLTTVADQIAKAIGDIILSVPEGELRFEVAEAIRGVADSLFDFAALVDEEEESSQSSKSSSSSHSSLSSSASSLSSSSSASSVSSSSSASSISESSSASSPSSSASSVSSSSSASSLSSTASSASSTTRIIPVPPVSKARIGIGIDPTTHRTKYEYTKSLMCRSQSDFNSAIQTARQDNSSLLIVIQSDLDVTLGMNALADISKTAIHPLVIISDDQGPRARIHDLHETRPARGIAFMGVDFPDGVVIHGGLSDILFEDFNGHMDLQGLRVSGGYGAPLDNCVVRFGKLLDATSNSGNAHNLFAFNRRNMLLEYNVFDHGGWSKTATRSTPQSSGGPTNRNHNAYLAGPASGDIVRYNVFSRASSHGIHFRMGGLIHDNLFIDNPIALQFGYGDDGYISKFAGMGTPVTGECRDNVIVGSDWITSSSKVGGIGIWVTATQKPTLFMNNIALEAGQQFNSAQAMFRIESQHPVYGEFIGNKSSGWGLNHGGFYKEPQVSYPPEIIEQGNEFEVPADLTYAQYVRSIPSINTYRTEGIDPTSFHNRLDILRACFN